jgi:hypothetical protein
MGAYVVNARINARPANNRANRSPYKIYNDGKETIGMTSYILDSDLMKTAKLEYSLTAM